MAEAVSRGRGALLSLALLIFASLTCHKQERPSIQIVVGPGPAGTVSFVPRSALGEYLALPGRPAELELSVASHELYCDRYVPPAEKEASVHVLVSTPPGSAPGPGSYPWTGTNGAEKEGPRAIPKVFIGKQSWLLQPGGELRIDRITLEPDGVVEAVLGFEFPGDADHPATSVRGWFRARLCRVEGSTPHR